MRQFSLFPEGCSDWVKPCHVQKLGMTRVKTRNISRRRKKEAEQEEEKQDEKKRRSVTAAARIPGATNWPHNCI
ncbi:hypothetical protein ElyMa_006766700 [Elysia marginata]|uniref:Uncharacterized protein n=1 Tax=Elysia marginata TaxID=1093978 RepID=A0AAV4IYN2_9GAST|nr:hypothetical protein ElyMa_006766700 [Elysia marginata]